MKPQELAKQLGIADVTLRKWAGKDFAQFLSPSATVSNGARRSFSDQDVRIMLWIGQMKDQNMPADEITAVLGTAQESDWHNLPPMPATTNDDIALMPREAAETRLTAIQQQYEVQVQALRNERDELRQRLEQMGEEKEEFRRKYFEVTEQLLELNRRLTSLLEKEQRRRK
ncbi:MAG: MerR family transcriptional regulator [Chloroflexota bacterium]